MNGKYTRTLIMCLFVRDNISVCALARAFPGLGAEGAREGGEEIEVETGLLFRCVSGGFAGDGEEEDQGNS